MLGGNLTEAENGTTTAFPDPADSASQPEQNNGWKFFFLSLCVIFIFILLSAMVSLGTLEI